MIVLPFIISVYKLFLLDQKGGDIRIYNLSEEFIAYYEIIKIQGVIYESKKKFWKN